MFMFPIEYFIGLVLIGICAGFASGLLGIGGGFLIVPLQYFLLKYIGVEPDLAILISFGTSLAIIIPTSISGAYRHTRTMDNILEPGIRLGIFGIIGGFIGGFVASALPSRVLEIIFGILLLFITVNNIVNINKEREDARIPFNMVTAGIIGLLVGFSSGLLGVGGGIFLISYSNSTFGIFNDRGYWNFIHFHQLNCNRRFHILHDFRLGRFHIPVFNRLRQHR